MINVRIYEIYACDCAFLKKIELLFNTKLLFQAQLDIVLQRVHLKSTSGQVIQDVLLNQVRTALLE